MPLYEYRCKDCNHEFETRQRFSDDPLTVCPQCEGEIRRVINNVGVVFKGSGFYITDNRGRNSAVVNGGSSTDKSDSTSDSSSTSSDSASSETSTKSDSSQSTTSSSATTS